MATFGVRIDVKKGVKKNRTPGNTSTIVIDKEENTVTKTVHAHLKYDIVTNEVKWLNLLEKYDRTAPVLSHSNSSITMRYVGELLFNSVVPEDWKDQIQEIADILKENHCYHCDIKASDIVVLNKRMYLLDFQWAVDDREDIPPYYYTSFRFVLDRNGPIKYDNYAGMERAVLRVLEKGPAAIL